ncbi:MAG TPA: NAD(P)-dependent oxidoreductase [Ktedonobacteraceae bacterium]|nr:NAD(P)-dependent oxidoreductase [Ktedonobacteraceae bacterium]
MAQLGFVGLGNMGGGIVKRLLDAGHTVVGYNRTWSKAQWLLDAGMQWGETPRQVAETADVTFSMVANSAALRDVFGGHDGILAGLGPGKIYVDMSTVSPSISRELSERVAAKGAQMLDAPISGNVITLVQGTSSIMVGGDQATFEKIKPILLDIGSKVNYIGGNGQALLMKAAINLSLPIQFMGFCEGVLLAEKGGIPRETAIRVWLSSALVSPATEHHALLLQEKSEEVMFNVNMMQKDMLLALELGRELDVALPAVALSNEILTAARAMGLAREDYAIMFEVLAQLAGLNNESSAKGDQDASR